MISLITQLENLKGPSREVDAEIAKAMGWKSFTWEFAGRCGLTWYAPLNSVGRPQPPNYTGSIDAARSICSDALLVYASDIGGDGLPYVELCTSTATPVAVHEGIGATTEIAWWIAALKAREADNAD